MSRSLRIVVPLLLTSMVISGVACAEPNVTYVHDVVYGHKDGLAMTFDVVKPTKPNGAGVLFMVSGGWFSRWFPAEGVVRKESEPRNGFETLVDNGYTLFLVRHGSAPRYKVPDAVDDVRRAVRFVRLNSKGYGIEPTRIGVFGGSAGGHLSLMLGTTADDGDENRKDPVLRASDRVAAVVAQFPPTNLANLVGPSKQFPALDFDPDKSDSVSPLLHVTEDDAPTLLIHGDKDRLVPLSHSEKIKQAFDEHKVPVKLIVLEGAGHGFSGDDERRAIEAMVQWFDKHLAKSEKADKEAHGKQAAP